MLVSLVIARVVMESGSPAPQLTDDAVLLVQRRDVTVGNGCGGDAGPDGGVPDGGADAGPIDGGPIDAGVDAGMDGGGSDAGCTSIPGDAITMMVQPRFSRVDGGARFAILMVTPARPIVETESAYVFSDLAVVTAPRIEVHETRIEDPSYGSRCELGSSGGGGCGFGASEPEPSWDPPPLGDGGLGDGGLTVDTIGPYQVVRAEPADTAELASWLTTLGYLYLPADLDAVAPYVARGYTVVAVRVALPDLPDGQLSPIALTWPGAELRLPVALGSPSGAALPTTVYIAGPGRYELPGADVPFAWRTSWGDEGFLTRNEVMLDHGGDPDDDPVAVRVPGDPEDRVVEHEYRTVRVPVNDCDEELDLGCGCGRCATGRRVRGDGFVVVGALALALRRRRRGRTEGDRAARRAEG